MRKPHTCFKITMLGYLTPMNQPQQKINTVNDGFSSPIARDIL